VKLRFILILVKGRGAEMIAKKEFALEVDLGIFIMVPVGTRLKLETYWDDFYDSEFFRVSLEYQKKEYEVELPKTIIDSMVEEGAIASEED
jgi:hypothetical protein